jgi:hypothetical protein
MGKVPTLHADAQRECGRDTSTHNNTELLYCVEWRMREQAIRILNVYGSNLWGALYSSRLGA